MTRRTMKTFRTLGRGRLATIGLFALFVATSSRVSLAQQTDAKTFSSPAEAAHALFLAVRNEDEQAVGAILGAGKEITSSNDQLEDKLERERFSQKYQEMHRLVREPDGRTVLYIGAENWPFPIPLLSRSGHWFFDSDAGKKEILFRRIGENETTAIQVCRAFAAAKKQKPTGTDDEAIIQYSQNLANQDKPTSEVNATSFDKESSQFHGYHFRIVKTRALSLIAYPAGYRSSGVMTFIVTDDGAVEEKDLGPDTTNLAPNIKQSISSWHAAE